MTNKMYHWAEFAAEKIIRENGDKKIYTVASGITPSGTVHIGNFREIITVDLVKKALEKRGKKVRFIYSWDDYDVFRKVAKNLPKQKELQKCLRMAGVDMPDPYGCHKSYTEHFEKELEEILPNVNIFPEFIYQNEKYRNGDYSKDIKFVLENTEKIKAILNQFREKELTDEWLPITLFCSSCKKDTLKKLEWLKGYDVYYMCECGNEEKFNFKKKPIVKLKWRADWPMRWNYESVDFEPGGKDHSTPGGSFDTGKQIIKSLWKKEAPTYVMYDFINVKGQDGKMSSSKGNVTTLNDVLEVYEPEVVRYLFAGTRPNREFSISFDVDVIKIYEDFDKMERVYYDLENAKEKDKAKHKTTYELSYIGKIQKVIPYQSSFRHLTTLLQINELDINKTIKYYEQQLKNDHDKKRLKQRAKCAVNWLNKYAPEEFKFTVQKKCQITLADEEKKILHQLASKLDEKEWTDKDLHEEIYILCRNNEFPIKDFFRIAYQVIVNKDKGPKLASFILEIGRERVAKLLKNL